jgi:hypothetical protein
MFSRLPRAVNLVRVCDLLDSDFGWENGESWSKFLMVYRILSRKNQDNVSSRDMDASFHIFCSLLITDHPIIGIYVVSLLTSLINGP